MGIIDNQPLVTVIASVYNGEKYLSECITSILYQDYKNIEVILVDDGSQDKSGEIINQFSKKDSRITAVYKDNSGVSASRNSALDIANGDYICIIDQDDMFANDYISYFLKLINENSAQIALTPSADKFFRKPNIVSSKDNVQVISGIEAVETMLYHKFIISPWNKMISRKLIEDYHIRFNTKYFNGEGFAFSIECFQAADKVAVGHRKVYQYRVGDPTSGASIFKKEYLESSINAQKYILSKLKNPNIDIKAAWNFSNWHTHCDAFNIMVGCKAQSKSPELYKYLEEYSHRYALLALKAPISMQQKLRGVLFAMSPVLAAHVINHFRIRKFKEV